MILHQREFYISEYSSFNLFDIAPVSTTHIIFVINPKSLTIGVIERSLQSSIS